MVAYFLDQLPPDPKASELPAAARDVVIAKVRLLQSPSWNGPRHPAHPSASIFHSIKILDVRSGSAAIGAEYNIYFGREMVNPNTPEQAIPRECMMTMCRTRQTTASIAVEVASKVSVHAKVSESISIRSTMISWYVDDAKIVMTVWNSPPECPSPKAQAISKDVAQSVAFPFSVAFVFSCDLLQSESKIAEANGRSPGKRRWIGFSTSRSSAAGSTAAASRAMRPGGAIRFFSAK